MTKRVLTVGCEIPGGFGEYVNFDSKASLLDADFVVFCPTLGSRRVLGVRSSVSVLSEADSETLQNTIDHWKRELTDVLNAGNTVFVMLCDPEKIGIRTGNVLEAISGTSQVATNYAVLPYSLSVIASKERQWFSVRANRS